MTFKFKEIKLNNRLIIIKSIITIIISYYDEITRLWFHHASFKCESIITYLNYKI